MKQLQAGLMVALLTISVYLGGCSSHSNRAEHYRSAQVEGESAKINLDEVQKAFWDSKGKDSKDFDGWMQSFEKRVNEIYDGKDVVSIDATRDNGKLVVTGYIDKLKQEGFKEGDEKLFSIELNAGCNSGGKFASIITRLRRRSMISSTCSIVTGHSCIHA